MKSNLLAWGVALAACVPLLATAQATKTERPKATSQLTYQSAFTDYKPYKHAPLADWRELNDTVAGPPGATSGRVGPSMGGMKGMETPPAPPAPAAPASSSMQMKTMPMHGGHPKNGGKP